MRTIKKALCLLLLVTLSSTVYCQNMRWSTTRSVKRVLKQQERKGMTFYSQSDWYAPRKRGDLNSQFADYTGKDLYMYGIDFSYASGTWFSDDYKKSCRDNLINIVKEAWKKNKAIPIISWHLENPYANAECTESMGCRYRYAPKVYPNYPEEHRYVIREILNNTGGPCGFGRYKKPDVLEGHTNPREWFEERCKEVAGIINELTTDNGKPIPFIFRLWHECEDKWHWWGVTSSTDEEYKEFFILTEKLIRKYAPSARILWGYCTDRYWTDEENYMRRYPGDQYVDIIGYDDYGIRREFNEENDPIARARSITRIAKKHKKIAAIFETANKDGGSTEDFFREKVNSIMRDRQTQITIFQLWTSNRFITEEEKKDRRWFLNQPYIIVDGR